MLIRLCVKFVSGFFNISYFHVHFKTALASEAEILWTNDSDDFNFDFETSMFTRTNDNVIKTTLGSIKMGFGQILLQLMLKNISNFFYNSAVKTRNYLMILIKWHIMWSAYFEWMFKIFQCHSAHLQK